MKNCTYYIGNVSWNFSFKPIQVSTPLKRSNYMDENVRKYEVEEQWLLDEG